MCLRFLCGEYQDFVGKGRENFEKAAEIRNARQ